MRRAGLILGVLVLAGLGAAKGQQLPQPLPEDNPDAQALADRLYPSATVCAECHPNQFSQWSNSSHAYANLSPMFNKFEQKINDLARGTINSFCVRCHASVGTALGERRDIALWERSKAAREGITCVTCHRVGEAYGKVNAARRIAPGDIHEPVFGPFDSQGVLKAIGNARRYRVLVSSDEPDRPDWLRIHQQAIQSDLMVKSEFCVACHQVQVYPGIKLGNRLGRVPGLARRGGGHQLPGLPHEHQPGAAQRVRPRLGRHRQRADRQRGPAAGRPHLRRPGLPDQPSRPLPDRAGPRPPSTPSSG